MKLPTHALSRKTLPRLVDHCGCTMGRLFLGAAFVASVAWVIANAHSHTLIGISGRVMGISLVAGICGKLLGIVFYRRMLARHTPRASFRDAVDPGTFRKLNPMGLNDEIDMERSA